MSKIRASVLLAHAPGSHADELRRRLRQSSEVVANLLYKHPAHKWAEQLLELRAIHNLAVKLDVEHAWWEGDKLCGYAQLKPGQYSLVAIPRWYWQSDVWELAKTVRRNYVYPAQLGSLEDRVKEGQEQVKVLRKQMEEAEGSLQSLLARQQRARQRQEEYWKAQAVKADLLL